MPKVEHRFAGRCPRCQYQLAMQRIRQVERGTYEWRGRCPSGHHLRLIVSDEETAAAAVPAGVDDANVLYVANPVVVEAHIITDVGEAVFDGSVPISLLNGDKVYADASMIARYVPSVGDYWVIQEDGYCYLNPKHVFERKYSALGDEE